VGTKGDQVICAMGQRFCTAGTWGGCFSEKNTQNVVLRPQRPSSDVRLLSLGSPTTCPSGFDPCDPYCNVITDVPDNTVTVPSGLVVKDAGITIVATGSVSCTGLEIQPSGTAPITVTVTALSGSPLPVVEGNPINLTAVGTPVGCPTTAFDTTWTIDKFDRATISGSKNNNGKLTLASPIAGDIVVTAYGLGTFSKKTVHVKVKIVDPVGVTAAMAGSGPADVASTTEEANAFKNSSGDPLAGTISSTATWLYPYQDTVFPLGLLAPVMQYKYSTAGLPASGTIATHPPATKVTLRYPATATMTDADFSYAVIVQEQNVASQKGGIPSTVYDPQVVIPQAAWIAFEQTARGDDAALAIQRWYWKSAATLEQETTRRIKFADAQLKGTVYYKSYNSAIAGTSTAPVGAVLEIKPAATAPTVAVSSSANHCTVCHSVSAQGNLLLFNSGGFSSGDSGCSGSLYGADAAYGMSTALDNSCAFSLPGKTSIKTYKKNSADQGKFEWGGPYPDGSFYLANSGDNHSAWTKDSALFKVSDATQITTVTGTPSSAVTPAFAPDGRSVAYNDGWVIVVSEFTPCKQFGGGAGESVEIRNDSPNTVPIVGWTVRNSGGTACATVPTGTANLATGQTKILNYTTACLNDTSDTLQLYDGTGALRYTYTYTYAASACTSATEKGSWLSCPRERIWKPKTSLADVANTCSGLSSPVDTDYCTSSRANTFVAGSLLKARDFSCGAASGSTTCNTGATWSFSNDRTIVDCQKSNCVKAGYPSYLPDSVGIVYQHMTKTSQDFCSELNSMNGAMSQIWLTSEAQPFTPIALNALNGLTAGGANYLPTVPRDVSLPTGFTSSVSYDNTFHAENGTTSWVWLKCSAPYGTVKVASAVKETELNYLPTVSPQEAGGYYWVVFMSRRLYGNVAISNPWQSEMSDSSNSFNSYKNSGACGALNAYGPRGFIEAKKLWIAAIDKDWQGKPDPSHPAFYLPGQELVAGNSHGFWTSSACGATGATCDTDDDCCGGTGSAPTSHCAVTSTSTVPATKKCVLNSSCVAEGATCTTTSQCCSGLVCPTGGGVCMNVPVVVYTQQLMTREFVSTCPLGTTANWQLLQWQATIPLGTSIVFSVQSKLDAADTYAPSTPIAVATADSTTATGVWGMSSSGISSILAASNIFAGPYLQMTMTFKPDGTGTRAPTLGQWRVLVDCVPTN
jgi:hypothetical protein